MDEKTSEISPLADEPIFSEEELAYMGAAAIEAPSSPEADIEEQLPYIHIINGERLSTPFSTIAYTYLDKVVVRAAEAPGLAAEAPTFQGLNLTPEERLHVRDLVAKVSSRSEVERTVMPLVKVGDWETILHEIRVAGLVVAGAKRLGDLSPNDEEELIEAALAHDAGKADEEVRAVTNQKGSLSPDMRKVMEKHVAKSVEILEQADIMSPRVKTEVASHHEEAADPARRFGVPHPHAYIRRGLLPYADELDAICTPRIYRPTGRPAAEGMPIVNQQLIVSDDIRKVYAAMV